MSFVSLLGKSVLQDFLIRDAFLWRLRQREECALTFDDGPHPVHTPAILDLLASHQIKATFFVVGETAARAPELLRRIAAEGHALGSHTLTHREFPSLGARELQHELDGCRDLIAQHTGVQTRLVRPPRGRMSLRSLRQVARSGYTLVHWSKTFSDYLQDGVAPLLARMRARQLRARDIALLHDTNAYTVEALRSILPEWRARGLSFRTIGQGA